MEPHINIVIIREQEIVWIPQSMKQLYAVQDMPSMNAPDMYMGMQFTIQWFIEK